MPTCSCWGPSTTSRPCSSTSWPSCRPRATRRRGTAGAATPRPDGREVAHPWTSGLDQPVRIEHELLGRALVEVLVALRGVVQGDDGGFDGLGDLHLVVEDRLHQTAVVLHHRALAGGEAVRLGPPQADADGERALLRGVVRSARIAGDVEPRDAELAARARDVHDRVEDRRRRLVLGVLAVAARLEADG